MVEQAGKCPNCGYQNTSGSSMMHDKHAADMAMKNRHAHPFITGALSALYAAKRAGLIPGKCPKCGTTYWLGGKMTS